MREILFRGKRVDSGEWVEGWYVPPVEFGGHKFGTAISYICEQSYLVVKYVRRMWNECY